MEGAMPEDEVLIEAVRTFPCLWHSNNPGHKDQQTKDNAWREVAATFENLSVEECMKRWKCLRDKYVRELKKAKCATSGDEGPPPKSSSWPLYNIMSFVQESVRHRTNKPGQTWNRKTHSLPHNYCSTIADRPVRDEWHVEEQSTDLQSQDGFHESEAHTYGDSTSSDHEATTASASTNGAIIHSRKRKRRVLQDPMDTTLSTLKSDMSSNRGMPVTESDASLFGKQVAATLERFTLQQRAWAKVKIDEVLFNVEFGSSRR